ncbi:MAG: outer membrane lipoprotein carrier protein LolA [Bacteroidales bacterium]|nr:outer membrane lipoprotein carrier protein LolA [Bacteroidales bacterium]
MKKILSLILATCVLNALFAQTEVVNGVVVDHTAEKIVKNAVEKLQNDTPFSFSFAYNLSEQGEKAQKGSGTFLSNGNKYRVESSDFNDYCNGTTLWHYIKSNNEVEISDVEDGNAMFNFTKIINQYAKSYRPKLIRYESFNKVNCAIIDLTPKKSSSISKVRLWTAKNDNRILQMIIYVRGGTTYTYTFSNYKAKTTTTDEDFVFQKSKFPKAKVVDLR